ncbi:hypothetical protein MMC13_000963 [Lambiella insularis]|nr:hypothetical protein [Lambiella insularis]
MESSASAEALLPLFQLETVLNQDQAGRRITLLGSISSQPALLTMERAALPNEPSTFATLHSSLANVANLGANDIYAWYTANLRPSAAAPDLKLNLIYPCTEMHIKKHSPQIVRVVTETPELYAAYVRPYMQRQREGRMEWVYNIIDGKKEQEDIILRESRDLGKDPQGFLLLPDMNWDRKTMSSLRILGLVERRDLWSVRDLKKSDVEWLKKIQVKILQAIEDTYGVEGDLLKLYMHYQPTYYHFHIHITSTQHEPSTTQALLKAFSLPNLISQLESFSSPSASLADIAITYTLGDASDLWNEVFLPLKEGKTPSGPKASTTPEE